MIKEFLLFIFLAMIIVLSGVFINYRFPKSPPSSPSNEPQAQFTGAYIPSFNSRGALSTVITAHSGEWRLGGNLILNNVTISAYDSEGLQVLSITKADKATISNLSKSSPFMSESSTLRLSGNVTHQEYQATVKEPTDAHNDLR